jgi:thymidylate kinase
LEHGILLKTSVAQNRIDKRVIIGMEVVDEPPSYATFETRKRKSSDKLSLERIFDAFDAAEIAYCLLRDYENPAEAFEKCEIDLLVDPHHLLPLERILDAHGFVSLPAWGHAPHSFYVGFDRRFGVWIKFDVVTGLRYGKPIRTFSVDLLDACLRNRRRGGLGYSLSAENELITLFLHCMLDKAEFKEKHRKRFSALSVQAAADQTLDQQIKIVVDKHLAPELDWNSIASAIELDRWQSLLNKRSVVIRKFFLRAPMKSIWRNYVARAMRRLRPLLFALFRRGFTVALLAPDGAGKSTLAYSLTRDPYLRARLIYMGTNVKAQGLFLPTTQWLHTKIKKSEARRAKLGLKILKGMGFINRVVEQWYRSLAAAYHVSRGRFVVYDRFVYDSWLVSRPRSIRKRIRRWLLEAACPSPDLVVLLDAPGDLLFKRKGEHSPEWLELQRQSYLNLLPSVPNMIVVDAQQDAEEVRKEVTALIWKKYSSRDARTSR